MWTLQAAPRSLKTAFHILMFYFSRENQNVTNNVINVINPKVYLYRSCFFFFF